MLKILVLRFSSIGDIVLTTPVVRNLKKQLPDCQVHYCTKPNFRILLETNPYIDKIHTLDGSLTKLISQLKKENFDFIIDLHNNLRTSIIKYRLGKTAYSFNKLNWQKWLLVNFKINKLPNVHIVDRYMGTLAKLGVKNDFAGLDYFIPEKDKINITTLPNSFHQGYTAVCIGAQHFTKKLPPIKLAELIGKIKRPVILLGGREDEETGQKILSILGGSLSHEIYNSCGKYNLNQSASLLQTSEQVYTHDTGLMHIASAFKKKIFSIWGNTVPEFGMYPYMTTHLILENKGLECRPCSKIGYQKCPKGHFKCMMDQNFEIDQPDQKA